MATRDRRWSHGTPTPKSRSGVGELEDGPLVRRVLAGHREDFSQLVRRHQDELYRYARGMRIEHDSACDLVQEAFVTAYGRLDQCRDPDRFRYWLFRILRNACLDWLKNIRRRSVALEDVTLESERDTPHDSAHRLELRQTIATALDNLSDDLREAFLMKHHEGRSYDEMAQLTQASVSAMKMRVHRAREALREELQGAGIVATEELR